MSELEALKKLSARVGSDSLLVQAAGGNTSIKQDGIMWIKASGTWLRDAMVKDIFVPLDHLRVVHGLTEDDPACETCAAFVRGDLNATGLRPSIETTVHALMPQRVVVHVHCVNTISWAIRADAERLLHERLGGFNWAFVPYARPGIPLAHAISQRLRPGIDVLVLGNHGLVVAADTVAAAETLLERVVARLRIAARILIAADFLTLKQACAGTPYAPANDPETHALATDTVALGMSSGSVFYPDHVVFLGVGISTHIDSGAPLVALSGKGVLIRHDANPAVEPMGRCLADVMRRTGPATRLSSLGKDDIAKLQNWDAEKYRQNLGTPP